jgi:hypothetical protein
MPYRICTFDIYGKILSVSPESYPDNQAAVSGVFSITPGAYAFVDESLIPPDAFTQSDDLDEDYRRVSIDGTQLSFASSNSSDFYDPRVEVSLSIEDPTPFIKRNANVVQDITKAVAVYNLQDPTTRPMHSNAIYKTESGSCKFTRSLTGYSGGYIHITNLSKRDQVSGATAPHNDIAKGLTFSYAVEMYFYPTTFDHNFTLVQKGPTGASANWKLSFDSSAGQLQFAWQSYNTTGGYNNTQNIVNTAGMSLNAWNHVAVSLVRTGTVSVGYLLSGYFNGINQFTQSVTLAATPETRGNGGLFLGNNSAGTEAFDGYIDMFRLLESPSTGGIFGVSGYGFLPFGGGTLSVPTTEGFVRSSEAPVMLNFNGLEGTSEFYCETTDYVVGVASRLFENPGSSYPMQLGLRGIVRHTLSVTMGFTGLSDPTGFSLNYGSITIPFVPSGPTQAHGYDHSFKVFDVFDEDPDLDVYIINYLTEGLYEYGVATLTLIEGASGNIGSSGSYLASSLGTNPFRRLFSGGAGNCYGGSNAYTALFIDPTDSFTMSYIMDNGFQVTQGVCLAAYTFVDGLGLTRTINAKEISDLRLDLLEYSTKQLNAINQLNTDLSSATTKTQAKMKKYNDFNGKLYSPAGTQAPTLGVGDIESDGDLSPGI